MCFCEDLMTCDHHAHHDGTGLSHDLVAMAIMAAPLLSLNCGTCLCFHFVILCQFPLNFQVIRSQKLNIVEITLHAFFSHQNLDDIDIYYIIYCILHFVHFSILWKRYNTLNKANRDRNLGQHSEFIHNPKIVHNFTNS